MRTTRAWVWIGILIGLFGTDLCSAQIVYVDDDAPLGGDGRSWDTAFRYLQDGFYLAQDDESVTEIRIAGGVYRPDEDEAGLVTPGDGDASFTLLDRAVAIRGGFRGLEGPGESDEQGDAFQTVLSSAIGDPTPQGEVAWLLALRDTVNSDTEGRVLRLERLGLTVPAERSGVGSQTIELQSRGPIELERVRFSIHSAAQLILEGNGVAMAESSVMVAEGGFARLWLRGFGAGTRVQASSFTSDGLFSELVISSHAFGKATAEFDAVRFDEVAFGQFRGFGVLRQCEARDSVIAVTGFAAALEINDSELSVTGVKADFTNLVRGYLDDWRTANIRLVDSRVYVQNGAPYRDLIAGAELIRTEIIGEGPDSGQSGVLLGFCGPIRESTIRGVRAAAIAKNVWSVENSSFIGNSARGTLVEARSFDPVAISGSLFAGNDRGIVVASSIRSSTFIETTPVSSFFWLNGEIVGCVIVSAALLEDDVRDSVLWGDGLDQVVAGGNVFAEPVFVDPLGPDGIEFSGDEDWTLAAGSPGVDLAELGLLDGLSRADRNGNPRFVDSTGDGVFRVDAGAIERQGGAAATCEAELLASGSGVAPDSSLTVQDLMRYVEQWLALNPFADHTTAGANPGEEAWADPDGAVSVEDLTRYAELWIGDCD
ncbi:MAG: GC-type dockerin domain-anchored protein [Planctomycetota bacterium]